MARVTPGHLEMLVKKIGETSNIATSREEAAASGQTHFLFLEYAAVYGGYRLVKVAVKDSALSGAFYGNETDPRKSAKEMESFLNGLLMGLTYQKG